MYSHSERLQTVLQYIEDRLHEDIRLDELAAVSHLSKYHFSRVFTSLTGEPPMAYVNARRLVRALRLLAETDRDMTDIALSCGFGSLSAFHAAFKRKYRMTPGDYRKSRRRQHRNIRNKSGNFPQALSAPVRYDGEQRDYVGKMWRMNVAIVTLPAHETACVRHVGSYLDTHLAWDKLRAWINRSGMPTEKAIYIGMPLDSPEANGEHACRYDACVTLPAGFVRREDPAIRYETLPGGLYALYKFYDTIDRLGIVYRGLFREWLPTSGYAWDGRPCLEIAMNNPAEDPDGRSKIDLYIPVRPIKREGEIELAKHPFVPKLHFDGQRIDVLWDNYDNAIRWLERHFGWAVSRRENWKVDPACREGWMTQMNYGTWLVTYLADVRLPHHHADRGGAEGNVRLCFRVKDLEKRHEAFTADGVRVTDVYEGPKTRYFDVWATPEGIRLTLQEDPGVAEGGVFPSWVRIGVSDLREAIEWQQNVTGMRLLERDPDGRFAIMALGLNHAENEDSLWVLEQLPEGAHTGNVSGQVQPVCWVKSRDAFFKYHQYLKSIGVETSEVGGFVARGMVGFHFFDPDGNRFNISSM